MVFPFVVVTIVLAFVAQIFLCFCVIRSWIKCIPLYLIGAGELACAAGYFLFDHIYGAAFAALIYGIVLLIMLAVDVLAWLIYAIVKKTQKSK